MPVWPREEFFPDPQFVNQQDPLAQSLWVF